MKIVALALCITVAMPLHAGRRRAVAPPNTALSIEFVHIPAPGATLIASGSDAWLDVNTISQEAGVMGKALRVRRQFGLRVLRAGGGSWGSAIVTARLGSLDGRSSLRIDGQPLTSTPIVIDSNAAVGVTAVHTMEIEISDTVAAGPLESSIAWEVTIR